MATRRTFAQIKSLFAENTVGAIGATDLQDFVETVQMYQSTGSPALSDDGANTSGRGVFTVGSEWAQVSSDGTVAIFWKCVDAATNNAKWVVSGIHQWNGLQEETSPSSEDQLLIRTAEGYRWVRPTNIGGGGTGGPAEALEADGETLTVDSMTDGSFVQRSGTGLVATKTVPAGSVVGTTDSQVLTNKTLTNSLLQEVYSGVLSLNGAGANTVQLGWRPYAEITLTGDSSIAWGSAPDNGKMAETYFIIRQDSVGNHQLTLPGDITWKGEAPDVSKMGPNELGLIWVGSTDGGTTKMGEHDIYTYDEVLEYAISPEKSDAEVGTAVFSFRMPFHGEVAEVKLDASTAPTGSTAQVDINNSTNSIFSTPLTLDPGEETSVGAAVQPVISDPEFTMNEKFTVDIDSVGSGDAGQGFKLKIYVKRTG